jgi:rhodanese-related sulfurtransferase
MKFINNHKAQEAFVRGNAIIIDVREPAEFREKHIPGALNLPSTKFNIEHYTPFQSITICLVCESGNRAGQIAEKLKNNHFDNVLLLETQMQSYSTVENNTKGWTIDRQFRMTLGLLLAVFLFFNALGITGFIVIPIILCVGLIFTALINQCYMRQGIAMLPWNKGKVE